MNVIKNTFFILALLISTNLIGQDNIDKLSPSKLKKLAEASERIKDWESASIYYEAYLDKKTEAIKIVYRLAENYRKQGSYFLAKERYHEVYLKESEKYPLAAFYYARMLVSTNNCKEAIPVFEKFRKAYRGKKDDRKYIRLSKFSVEGCQQAMLDSSKKNKFLINLLSGSINESHVEASPIYLNDEKIAYNSLKTNGQLVFDLEVDSLPQRQFYVASKTEGEWEHQGNWTLLNNFSEKEIANGAFNLKKNRFYFSACETNSLGNVDCDIYVKKKTAKGWSSAKKLPATVNTNATETQVAVGLDEKERETIYFVSNRKGGKGGLDIWYSTYSAKRNQYKEAKNAGSKINSVGDEITPFIHPLNRNLYFSSNGHPNYGGFDVFKSVGQRTKWIEPENIGPVINSGADELYYIVNENDEEGIFASNRLGNSARKKFCCDDLYEFKELDKIKIKVEGKISSDKEQANLEKTRVKLFVIDPSTQEKFLIQSQETNEDGEYSLRLEPNQEYRIETEKEGFLSNQSNISTVGIKDSKTITSNLKLKNYKNRSLVMSDIQYDYNSANLSDEVKKNIDANLYKLLEENPSIVIEISAHTDSVGSDGFNKNLSQRRAENVRKYLIKKGIQKSRITAKGYGESQPIAPNSNADGTDNPEGRAKNRRTEIKVIGKIELEDEDDF